MYLRPYAETDLEALYELDLVCFEPAFRFSRRTMRRLTREPGAVIRVAWEPGPSGAEVLLGFCIASVMPGREPGRGTPGGYLSTLDVAPNQRRGGVATTLLAAVEEELFREADRVYLHVFAGNEPAMRLYDRRGYVPERYERAFYGPGLDAWLLCKERDPASAAATL